jgi:hypothetical protein
VALRIRHLREIGISDIFQDFDTITLDRLKVMATLQIPKRFKRATGCLWDTVITRPTASLEPNNYRGLA